jgi:hypothetical protein
MLWWRDRGDTFGMTSSDAYSIGDRAPGHKVEPETITKIGAVQV